MAFEGEQQVRSEGLHWSRGGLLWFLEGKRRVRGGKGGYVGGRHTLAISAPVVASYGGDIVEL